MIWADSLREWVTGWGGNVVSVSALVGLIVVGLATSRLYTKSQVDDLKAQHAKALEELRVAHKVALDNVVETWKANRDDAVRREGEWRGVATDWQRVATTLSNGLEPLQEQGETMLTIVRELQRSTPRAGGNRR